MSAIEIEEYRAAFGPEGQWWSNRRSRRLVQLGVPTPTCLVVWIAQSPQAPPGSEPTEVRVAGTPDARVNVVHFSQHGTLRVEISNLAPGKSYEVELTLDGARERVSARTAPNPDADTPFSFLAGSCFQPFVDDGDGSTVKEETAHLLGQLRSRANDAAPPSFMLGLGDQIYVDSGALCRNRRAMLHGSKSQRMRYRSEQIDQFFDTVYRSTFSIEPFTEALRALPSAMMWDDHEIRDGWGSQGDEEAEAGTRWRKHVQTAREFFVGWQALRNPVRAVDLPWESRAQVGETLTESAELDFEFDWGAAASVFVMDLRSARNAGCERVISCNQFERFKAWLRPRERPTLFILGSTMPLTHVWRWPDILQLPLRTRWDDLRDSWWSCANRKQRGEIIEHVVRHFGRHQRDRLLILSGDVHFSELLELSLEGRVFGHEVVCSGIAQEFSRIARRSSQRAGLVAHGLHARAFGRYFGPAFAEVFVEPRGAEAPDVELVFRTVPSHRATVPAHVFPPRQAAIKLRLGQSLLTELASGKMFERFTKAGVGNL